MLQSLNFVSGGAIVTYTMAVAGGTLYRGAGSTFTSIAGTALTSTVAIMSTEHLQKLYIADATPRVYNPVAATYGTATATTGTFPTNRTIIVTWRDRLVMAGGTTQANNFDMSRQGTPLDWDFTQTDEGAAWSGQAGNGGQLGDVVTALVPHSDDCMLIGCQDSLWIMKGDPTSGGRIMRLSSEIGILDRGSHCYTPSGWLFFMSLDGLYAMAPGCGAAPISVSRSKIPEELLAIDRTAYTVTMAYDRRDQGVHIFVAKNSAATAVHYWVSINTEGDGGDMATLWPVSYTTTNHDPLSLHSAKNVTNAYSDVLLGCRDGYVRRHQSNLSQDDGANFTSYITLGPMSLGGGGGDYSEGLVVELVGSTAVSSGDVDWALKVGKTHEAAFNAAAFVSGEWNTAGLNLKSHPRARGGAFCLKLSNGETNATWAVERITAVIKTAGKQRV